MLYKVRRPHCHSLRNLLCLILVVAILSAFITYQLTTHLPTKSKAELTILLEERNYHLDKRRGLEGIDLEKHPDISQSNNMRQWNQNPQLDLMEITQKIKKREEEWFGRRSDCEMAVLESDIGSQDAVVIQTSAEYSYTQLFRKLHCHILQVQGQDIAMLKRPDNSIVWMTGKANTSIIKEEQLSKLYATGAKVNHIPSLQAVLRNKESVCNIRHTLSHVPDINVESVIPGCFLLPKQFKDFLGVQNGQSRKWIHKTLGPGDGNIHLLDMQNDIHRANVKSWSMETGILQKYFGPPLLFYGLPFEMKAYILVTSLSPLRAYVHTEGVVQSRYDYQRYFQKVPGRTWSFSQLRAFMANTHGTKTAEVMDYNVHSLILQTLFILDSAAFNISTFNQSKQTQCKQCFQLLEFDLIFNTSFHPVVLEIVTNPRMDKYPQQRNVLKDTIAILTANLPVYRDIAMMYNDLHFQFDSKSNSCYKEKSYRSEDELKYIIITRKEYLNRGKFHMLYPSASSDSYTLFTNALKQHYSDKREKPHNFESSGSHSTLDIHSTLTAVMKYFSNRDVLMDSYDDLSMFHTSSQSQSGLFHHVGNKDSDTEDAYSRKQCSKDTEYLPYLQSFHTEPSLHFTPVFRANVTDYYTSVPYDLLLVKIWAFAEYCHSEARLEHKYGVARPSLYTLGLGMNRVLIHVVDTTHTDPWIVSTYTLHIKRETPGNTEPVSSRNRTVCRLIQDCDLKYIPDAPCGLQNTSFKSWDEFLIMKTKLPYCVHSDIPGAWMFPCLTCSDHHTCLWDEGIWQPHTCSHPVMSAHRLKQCLAGKQVMFIGDSTNRGIMHYVMEKVNGSLTEWDKTHNMKIYSNVNNDRTTFSFGYYPQFWLPANQRPVFDKALYELLKLSGPVEKNHNTVLVVGGVHWLSSHHLQVLADALKREGLSKVKVIIKGLGAGFHQPVDGLHCLTLREQRKLLLHNQGLIGLARELGFNVVDTFNMTMARFKDFLQGKCACHFHTVKEVLPPFKEYLKTTSQIGESEYSDMPIQYHIEGEINRAYSEILVNSLCSQDTL